MIIKLTFKFIVPFIALVFIMNEAHELVHTSVGRLICGCWGHRDFNVWGLCENCISEHPFALSATFAGPVFTFIMIWIGALYIGEGKSSKQKSFGYAFIFANMPFARIFQALTGSGDEVWGLNQILHNRSLAQIIGFSAVFLITIFPLYKVYVLIQNKGRVWYFILFFLAPVLLDQIILLGIMNGILAKGLLGEYWILGSPLLITVWTVVMLGIFIFTRQHIYQLWKGKAPAVTA